MSKGDFHAFTTRRRGFSAAYEEFRWHHKKSPWGQAPNKQQISLTWPSVASRAASSALGSRQHVHRPVCAEQSFTRVQWTWCMVAGGHTMRKDRTTGAQGK